jgi:hypothetical protein
VNITDDPTRFLALLHDLGDARADRYPAPSPQERREILLGLGDTLLTSTPQGRARLERWALRGERPRFDRDELREFVRGRALCFGDAFALPIVVEALCLAPEPVREAAISEVAFLSVGIESTAWTGSGFFAAGEGQRPHRVIVLGPAADVRCALHEVAHVFLSAPLERSCTDHPGISVQGEQGFMAFLSERGERGQLEGFLAYHERLADAASELWWESRETT